jgi:4,5-dihydroxyphthalate decarboxylase
MAKQPIDIAFWNYDRTQALANGTVKVEGVEANFHTAKIVTLDSQFVRRYSHW